jgi:hypothetical protein
MATLLSTVLLATSLVGGAHRVGLLSTSGATGIVEPSPDTTTTTPTGSGDPSPTPSVSAPPQATVAGLLPISECKLGPTGSKWYFSAGFPIDDYSDVLTTGSLRIAVIYVEFPDAARRSPVSELHKKIEDHVSQIYSEMSYGKLAIDLIPSSDWIMMDKMRLHPQRRHRAQVSGSQSLELLCCESQHYSARSFSLQASSEAHIVLGC